MKTYIKPTIEFIELRAEERLATCRASENNMGHGIDQHMCFNKNAKFTGHHYDTITGLGPGKTVTAWGHCGAS